MKLTIKTLRQETFELEMPDTETVRLLKDKIENITKKEIPANRMTLIYAGIILENDKILKSYDLSENKFIVAMAIPSTASTHKLDSKTNDETKTKDPTIKTLKLNPTINGTVQIDTTTNSIETTPSSMAGDEGIGQLTYPSSETLLTSEELNNTIEFIIDATGYSENDVRRAFAASFNNPDRAVEYLINGIPINNSIDNINIMAMQESIHPLQLERTSNINVNQTIEQTALLPPTPLEFLRIDPHFHHIRLALRENPDLLEAVVLHIADSNPMLLNLIIQYQNEFINIINEPIDDIDDVHVDANVITDENDDINNDVQSHLKINMTPDDLAVIERLKNLGFSEFLCIEAYIACDKNEEQAANFLCLNQLDD